MNADEQFRFMLDMEKIVHKWCLLSIVFGIAIGIYIGKSF